MVLDGTFHKTYERVTWQRSKKLKKQKLNATRHILDSYSILKSKY